ncbi:hypothetical protein RintRC_2615 [Richelia intracellularis]|nr:hypothetical protein RintRC_2615 [Richelia intracellularis]
MLISLQTSTLNRVMTIDKKYTLVNISPLIHAGEDMEKAIAFYEQCLGFKKTHLSRRQSHSYGNCGEG